MKNKKLTNPEQHKKFQLILESYLKPPINWGQEYKLLKELVIKYPEIEEIEDLGFELNSLAFFKTEKGKKLLQEKIGRVRLERKIEEVF